MIAALLCLSLVLTTEGFFGAAGNGTHLFLIAGGVYRYGHCFDVDSSHEADNHRTPPIRECEGSKLIGLSFDRTVISPTLTLRGHFRNNKSEDTDVRELSWRGGE